MPAQSAETNDKCQIRIQNIPLHRQVLSFGQDLVYIRRHSRKLSLNSLIGLVTVLVMTRYVESILVGRKSKLMLIKAYLVK